MPKDVLSYENQGAVKCFARPQQLSRKQVPTVLLHQHNITTVAWQALMRLTLPQPADMFKLSELAQPAEIA